MDKVSISYCRRSARSYQDRPRPKKVPSSSKLGSCKGHRAMSIASKLFSTSVESFKSSLSLPEFLVFFPSFSVFMSLDLSGLEKNCEINEFCEFNEFSEFDEKDQFCKLRFYDFHSKK